MNLSVIIPVLNEGAQINEVLNSLKDAAAGLPFEAIVADGDPSGGTIRHIADSRVMTLIAERGRASQMNAGAQRASGDVLLFLHADTHLPRNAFTKIMKALDDGRVIGGAFDLGFNDERLIFKIIGRAASWKHRLTRVPYGDQAIFVRRQYFQEIGGYTEIPLMEDIELMKRVKRKGGRIAILPQAVTTSPRKWETDGIVYTIIRNWFIQTLYLLGVPARRLVKYYYPDEVCTETAGRNRQRTVKRLWILFAALTLLGAVPLAAKAEPGFREEFRTLADWKPLTFPKIPRHSTYTIRTEGDKSILVAQADRSASGIICKQSFDIHKTPVITWKWKISNTYRTGDEKKKSGDDYPLRIYVVFKYDPDEATAFEQVRYKALKLIYGEYPPHSSLCYIWANKKYPERILPNPYTAKTQMILLEKGSDRAGLWIEERVNAIDDYRKAFGIDPPREAAIAIMSDADNTGEKATGYMEYIEVSSQ